MSPTLSYAVITPAKNEAENLERLAAALLAQSRRPERWIIVDNGSTDRTPEVAGTLANAEPSITWISMPSDDSAPRGAPIVRAFLAGLAALDEVPDVVVKLDADVSFEPDYFPRLLGKFEADPRLGLASGTCLELENGIWREDYGARLHVRGATRAYRWDCLQDVLPLEERMGWDGIDEIKAELHDWEATRFNDLVFYHHRSLGEREGKSVQKWLRQGEMAHYMGYRFSYLLLRAGYRARREPAALAMAWSYLWCVIRRVPRCADRSVRDYLRRQQSARNLPLRFREVFAGRSR